MRDPLSKSDYIIEFLEYLEPNPRYLDHPLLPLSTEAHGFFFFLAFFLGHVMQRAREDAATASRIH